MTSSTTSKSAPQLDARQERDLKQAVQTLWVRFPGSLEDRYRDYAERRAAKLIQRSLYILIVLFRRTSTTGICGWPTASTRSRFPWRCCSWR